MLGVWAERVPAFLAQPCDVDCSYFSCEIPAGGGGSSCGLLAVSLPPMFPTETSASPSATQRVSWNQKHPPPPAC